MKKLFIFGFFFLLLLTNGVSAAEPTPEVKADAALLYDMDNATVLWEKAGDVPMAPASLIKLLNLLTAEAYLDFNEEVAVGPLTQTVYNGQLMGLKPGDILCAQELIYAMMLYSANDAAVAMAEYLVGDIGFYAALMDAKAWALGAVHTASVNVNGYSDADQKTTAYDLAVLGTAYMNNQRLKAFPAVPSHTLTWLYPKKTLEIGNINQFLNSYRGATGLKTGTTDMAGKCLVATVERDGKRYLAVALNSSDRYGDCIKMMDYAYQEAGALSVDFQDGEE